MKSIMIILLSVITNQIIAQKFYSIDLSKSSFDDPTIGLKYDGIKLTNALVSKSYKVTIKVSQEEGAEDKGSVNADNVNTCLDQNIKFKEAKGKIEDAEKENELPALITSLKNELDQVIEGCKEELKKIATDLLSKTERTVNFDFDLKENQNINIKIERTDDKSKSWEVTLHTPRTANYISHFGFTFSPNWVKTPDQYFSKLSGKNISNTDSFTITRLNSNGKEFWKDLSLTANFLIPFGAKKKGSENADLRAAWLAGVGVGGDARFTVFTGPALLFKDFTAIGLVFGVNYSHKLKGEYESGQGLKEQLSFDQLHVRGIRPDIMLTLSFRLSKKQLQGDIENIGGK